MPAPFCLNKRYEKEGVFSSALSPGTTNTPKKYGEKHAISGVLQSALFWKRTVV